MKGKQLSLLSKILALIFVLLCFTVTIFTGIVMPMDEVIKVALFVALVFSPVDVSLWMEKIFYSRRKTIPDDGKDPSDNKSGKA